MSQITADNLHRGEDAPDRAAPERDADGFADADGADAFDDTPDATRVAQEPLSRPTGSPAACVALAPVPVPRRRPLVDRVEAWISSTVFRSRFWHRVCSGIWLPYAFKSGIRFHKRTDKDEKYDYSAVLPFTRFNRNWYDAMAGAALLANSEIAGGMYVYSRCGGDYRVVCKELSYRFLRPCFGPAVYRCEVRDDLDALLATGRAFNIPIEMTIVQQIPRRPGKEYRVGRCSAVFHVSPKADAKARRQRRATP